MNVKELKSECNKAKSILIDVMDKLELIDIKEAAKLEKIIIKLEIWQNQNKEV